MKGVNKDLIGVIFKEFVGRFNEISERNLKPNVIKCAEDLAEELYRQREERERRRRVCEDKEVQTVGVGGKGIKNTKSIKIVRNNQEREKEREERIEETLVEQKMEIMMLTKQNSNLADKLLNMSLSQNNTPNQSFETSPHHLNNDPSSVPLLNVLPPSLVEPPYQPLTTMESPKKNNKIIIEEFKMNNIGAAKRSQLIRNHEEGREGYLSPSSFSKGREYGRAHERLKTGGSNLEVEVEDGGR